MSTPDKATRSSLTSTVYSRLHKPGRRTLLRVGSYALFFSLVVTITTTMWYYQQSLSGSQKRIENLQDSYVDLDLLHKQFTAREFAETLIHKLQSNDLSSGTLINTWKKISRTTTRGLDISAICVRDYNNGLSASYTSNNAELGLEVSSLCPETWPEPGPRADYYEDLSVTLQTPKENTPYHFRALKWPENDDPSLSWIIAIVPQLITLPGTHPTDDPPAVFFLASTISATILLSVSLGFFVWISTRRLHHNIPLLARMWSALQAIHSRLHITKNVAAALRGKREDRAEEKLVHDAQASINQIFSDLEQVLPQLKGHIRATKPFRKLLPDWDRWGESGTDVSKIAKRIVKDEMDRTEKQIELHVEDTVFQMISEDHAETLLANLIGNACRWGEPPINVVVTRTVNAADARQPTLHIKITNNGRAFERGRGSFEEGERNGLPDVEDVVALYGGYFRIKAGKDNRGAVAELTLNV